MRHCRDSFIEYLRTEVPNDVTVHPIRIDPEYPEYSEFEIDAINVSFFNSNFSVHISHQMASLDLVYKAELTGLDVAQILFNLLSNNFIQMYDYSNPSSPVLLRSQIYWDMDTVRFVAVPDDKYFHYNCTLDLKLNIL